MKNNSSIPSVPSLRLVCGLSTFANDNRKTTFFTLAVNICPGCTWKCYRVRICRHAIPSCSTPVLGRAACVRITGAVQWLGKAGTLDPMAYSHLSSHYEPLAPSSQLSAASKVNNCCEDLKIPGRHSFPVWALQVLQSHATVVGAQVKAGISSAHVTSETDFHKIWYWRGNTD
jgi:hypothetical protein